MGIGNDSCRHPNSKNRNSSNAHTRTPSMKHGSSMPQKVPRVCAPPPRRPPNKTKSRRYHDHHDGHLLCMQNQPKKNQTQNSIHEKKRKGNRSRFSFCMPSQKKKTHPDSNWNINSHEIKLKQHRHAHTKNRNLAEGIMIIPGSHFETRLKFQKKKHKTRQEIGKSREQDPKTHKITQNKHDPGSIRSLLGRQ